MLLGQMNTAGLIECKGLFNDTSINHIRVMMNEYLKYGRQQNLFCFFKNCKTLDRLHGIRAVAKPKPTTYYDNLVAVAEMD